MSSDQFSLSWNNFHNNLSSGFKALFKDEDLVDVTLSAEGHNVRAHKTVLSVCSPYFKDLFCSNPCEHPIVILHEVTYSALMNLLEFIYNGEVNVHQDEIPAFLRIAKALKVKGLTEKNTLGQNMHLQESNDCPDNETKYTGRTSQAVKRSHPTNQSTQKIEETLPAHASLSSMPSSPSPKLPRIDETVNPSELSSFAIVKPKEEPQDYEESPIAEDFCDEDEEEYEDDRSKSSTTDNYYGENSDSKFQPNQSNDMSSPGTLQCILGKRGMPRLIVDGYTFFKKATYKNKCFWYCKTNRTCKCPAVCWTVNGRIVKWPETHNHKIVPDVIQPGEDTVVPIQMLQQVLIDAAR